MTSVVSLVLLGLALVLGIILMENTSNALVRNRHLRFKDSWSRTDGPSMVRSKPFTKNLTREDEDDPQVHVQCRANGKACTDDDQCCTNVCLHFRRCSPSSLVDY
ncbi:uncharacterized protein LOC111073279 [Drosophila obscura]|uniref:uncharacterized protein LOC111073279 n=1 Tax=Drosophila obscura TaxID=7282 RepID=UPI000B9FA309|nr:uncharacterized protein LOC111073279 [Drosophila obscura]